uniref:RT_RNaseH_2 domain-containing protein n=1 Tax=Strongyloides papillosus TaxID=174720 RepID=A0A0N5B5L4_STREA
MEDTMMLEHLNSEAVRINNERKSQSRQRTGEHGSNTGAKVKAAGGKIVYFICGLENHKLFACPTKKSSKPSEKDASKVRRIVDRSTGLIIPTSINFSEGEVKVLDEYIDTGADMTLVSEELASRLITHKKKVKLQFGGEDRWEGNVFIVPAAVVPTAIMISTNYTHILLGSDSIKKVSARIACQETAPSITIRRQAKVSVPESQIKVFDKEISLLAKEYPDLITDKKRELKILSYIVESLEFITKEIPEIVMYAISSAKEEIISKECQSLINLKVLQPCLTPRFIRNLVVAYKDDKLRVCADLRRLNTCVKKIATYIPTPDVIISKLCGANFFLQVDLQAGYHHVQLDVSIQDYFAVFTPMGLFKFCSLPFDLTNAGVSVTDGVDLAIYIDDIIACSKTMDGLVDLTHRMFKALQGCKLKRSKIQFRQLRRWCGMVTYYARHVTDLQRIMAPLARLLKKGVEYESNQGCRESFNLINEILSKQPCLMIADVKKEFFLEVDSSLDSCGAVLLQKDDSSKLVSVAYYSKRFQLLKKPSSVTMLELREIVAAIRNFKGLTSDMTIITDHKPLLGMLCHGKAEELFQYLSVVEEAGCRIKYQQGSKMYTSDVLSRMHIRRHLAVEGGRAYSER